MPANLEICERLGRGLGLNHNREIAVLLTTSSFALNIFHYKFPVHMAKRSPEIYSVRSVSISFLLILPVAIHLMSKTRGIFLASR